MIFFEPYLFALIHSGADAAILLDLIEEKNATELMPWLVSELHRKTGGIQAWEKSARQFYKKDKNVASSLLETYNDNNKPEFVRVARELWQDGLFQGEFSKLYFDGMDPTDAPDLYLAVTIYLNDRNFSEGYYRIIQELMDKEERMDYIETFKWNKPAYVHVLCMESTYPEALRFASQHTDRWNIVDIMKPCLQFQPELALNILERKIEELLVEERGRNFYGRVARVLKNAADIPVIQRPAEKLAIRIYSFYSRLSALRDELRTDGLIRR